MDLPAQYAWLSKEPGPRILLEMLKLYGTVEAPGGDDNPLILKWAQAIGFGHVYSHDEIPWCGLTVAYAAAQAGWDYAPRGNPLWARNWLSWGKAVPKGEEMLGDVLCFQRGSAGHVAIYVGEDNTHFHILGGNQGDAVTIKRKLKKDLLSGRRCDWRVNQPHNVRKMLLSSTGSTSTKES